MGEAYLPGAMQSLAAQAAAFEALLLAASAAHKILRWRQLQDVARQFARVPASLAAAALGVALLAEICAASLLIGVPYRAAGAALAAALWSGYLGLIVRAILQDRRDVDCGCSFGPVSRPLGVFQAARNVALAALAILVWMSARVGAVPVQASEVLAGLALLALYGALDQVMGLRPLRSGGVV
jgi:hypothetical protein